MGARRPRPASAARRSPWSATPPRSSRRWSGAASASMSSPTRRPPTTRSPATSRPRSRSTTRAPCARTQPDVYIRRSMSLDGRPRPGDARVPGAPAPVVFDYGNNLRAKARDGRRRRTRSTTRASSRRSSGPSSAKGAARSAGRPCPAIPADIARDRPGDPASCSRTTRGLRRWIEMAQAKVPFQGLPARICWLGYGERARAGARVQRARADRGRGRADRHRARPPRRGLGRVAQPRDGGDARRLRRDRRLAAAQRARQHRGRARRG